MYDIFVAVLPVLVATIFAVCVLPLVRLLQVDNPCAVLDQENSKKFLQGSESDKYAFFMKATDLDRIHAVSGRNEEMSYSMTFR